MLGDMSFFAMKKLGILNLFDAHFCSSNLGVRKNNKENSLFSQVNNIMNIPPENCLMIGNDIIDDIESSRNLGFHTIFVDYGDKKANVLCDVRVNSTDEIYDLYVNNKLPSLPRILLTPYNQKHHAQRIDSQLTNCNISYAHMLKGIIIELFVHFFIATIYYLIWDKIPGLVIISRCDIQIEYI